MLVWSTGLPGPQRFYLVLTGYFVRMRAGGDSRARTGRELDLAGVRAGLRGQARPAQLSHVVLWDLSLGRLGLGITSVTPPHLTSLLQN